MLYSPSVVEITEEFQNVYHYRMSSSCGGYMTNTNTLSGLEGFEILSDRNILHDLLVEELQDLYYAENHLVKSLPKMVKAAHDDDLKQAFSEHLVQTEGHVLRLTAAFEILGVIPKSKPCKAMIGLVAEGQQRIKESKYKDATVADLALIGAAQKVEHYEMSGYGSVRSIADKIDQREVAKLLHETQMEEEKADKTLNGLAKPMLDKISERQKEAQHLMVRAQKEDVNERINTER
jgi:ferritin-like metal-binding protein YciE